MGTTSSRKVHTHTYIYIYILIVYKFAHIYLYIYTHTLCATVGLKSCQDLSIEVQHIFAVELEEDKRRLLLLQHPDVNHLFENVSVFEEGRGWCFVCNRYHEVSRKTMGIDVLISGPSCKDLSGLKHDRASFAGCYETGDGDGEDLTGTSGPTYKFGFRKALWGGHSIFGHTFELFHDGMATWPWGTTYLYI